MNKLSSFPFFFFSLCQLSLLVSSHSACVWGGATAEAPHLLSALRIHSFFSNSMEISWRWNANRIKQLELHTFTKEEPS